jgi:uncharacterized phage protein gp47/JayE
MYEDITFDIILKRMLDRVAVNAKSQGFSIDTREGSIIYNSLAPVAVELQNAYLELDNILNESFADTQSREYLIKRCAERGINVKEATKAIRRGVFNTDVPIGSRFSLNVLNYVVIEKITDGEFKLECETPGTEGNVESGELVAIDYIEGLTSARLIDVLITPGEDEEDTEHLRERYFTSLDSQAFGGNVADYKAKTNSLDGVGGVKVYPAWEGGGTVKLVIINSEHEVPSASLIYSVQEAIDPIQNRGQGVGIAPIGHEVSVFGCEGTTIDISTTIEFRSGWDWDSVKPYVETAIDEYFKELSANWDSSENLVVRISQLEARLLSVAGIHDIKNTKLNNVADNFTLGSDNIPIRGAVSNAV